MSRPKLLYSRQEMMNECLRVLEARGVDYKDIAKIAYDQQSKYTDTINMEDCEDSVLKILSLRDVFHILILGAEIDRITEENGFDGPLQNILAHDLGVFGVDEILGLAVAGLFGVIGQTNFGDIDVNKPGIVKELNEHGKGDKLECHTMLDDIVGAIAAAASTRVAQMAMEDVANSDLTVTQEKLF
ncbi:phosphatidylglycerophosphatase A [Mycoplasmatota bacterium WC44]